MALSLEQIVNPENLNLAEFLEEETLTKLGGQIKEGFNTDYQSCKQWMEENDSWMKLATQYRETKTFPWPRAANVKYPLVTTAAMQFSARAYPALIPNKLPVKTRIVGKEDETLYTLGQQVSDHMNYQLMYEMDDWEEDMDKLCIMLPIAGTVFKKTYYNPLEEKNVSELVLPRELIVNYWAKSLEKASRKCHILYLTKNDIHERVAAGVYLKTDLGDPQMPQLGQEKRKDINRTEVPTKVDETTPYTIIECHCFWDLDDDGYAEPYIVTIDYTSAKVLRIIARFTEDNIKFSEDGKKTKIIKIKPTEYFTKFGFVPNPDGGFYDMGFGLLLGPLNETINTSINQLLDAGTLAILQGGFLSKGVRMKGGEYKVAPNEWITVNATVDDLRKAIFPFPVKEPSNVMFQLLGTLVQAGEKVASIAEIFVGKMPGQNTPATTTMETVKQGMAVFTAIYKRVYRALDKEYKKLFDLNRRYLDEVIDYPVELTRQHYNNVRLTVMPAADPDSATDAEKLIKAQALMEMIPLGTVNPQVATKRYLEALRIEGIEELLNYQPPPDPKQQELEMKMQIEQMKAELKAKSEEHKLQMEQMKAEIQMANDQMKMQLEAQRHEMEMRHMREKHDLEMRIAMMEAQQKHVQAQADAEVKRDIMQKQGEAKAESIKKQGDQPKAKSEGE